MHEKFGCAAHRSSKATSRWLIGIDQVSLIVLQQFVLYDLCIQPLWYVLCSNRTILPLFHLTIYTRNYSRDGRHFSIDLLNLALTRWFMKASLPEVNQLTGKCFQMVRFVSKTFFSN